MGSVRIDPELDKKIRTVASHKGITRSEVFRNALEAYCERELASPASSRFDDIIGVVDVRDNISERSRELFGAVVAEKASKVCN